MTEFQIQYDGVVRDSSRVDARQVRLRLFRDREYYQFVTAIAPGPDLVLLGALDLVRPGVFWKAFALEGVPEIKDAIQRREIPLPDPTIAFEIFPSVKKAISRSKRTTGEATVGQVIGKFHLEERSL